MIRKSWLGYLALGTFCSCSPVASWQNGPSQSGHATHPQGMPNGTTGQQVAIPTSSELREIREKRDRAAVPNLPAPPSEPLTTGGGAENGQTSQDALNLPPLPPIQQQYRYAIPVPGRPGYVYNPFTHSPVDVRGIESGRLIFDETDPANRNADGTLMSVGEMPHKFRVP